MTALPEKRPTAKKTKSDDKPAHGRHGRHQSVDVVRREEGVVEGEEGEEEVVEGDEAGGEEVEEKAEVKQQQPPPAGPPRQHVADLEEEYSDDDEDDDDDEEDDSDHLIIKRKGSKAALPPTQPKPNANPKPTSKAPSPAPLSRVRTDSATHIGPNAEQVSRSAGRDRSRSRSRQMPRERQKAWRTSSSLEKFKRQGEDRLTGGTGTGGSGVFARTKSQIGFEVPGEDHAEEGEEDLEEYAAGEGVEEQEEQGEGRKSRLDNDVKRVDGMKNYQLGSGGGGVGAQASAGSQPKQPQPQTQQLQTPSHDDSNAQIVASPLSDETMQVPSSITNAIGHPELSSSSRNKPATPKLQVQAVPPASAFNLEESPKAGFPFPAPPATEGTESGRPGSTNSGRDAGEREGKKVEGGNGSESGTGTGGRRGRGMEPSPGGSETNTLIGSTASMPRTATPRLSAPPSAPPESTTSAPVTAAPSTRHIRTRDSHTSLRSLASIRNAGPPPHPLSSPRNARTSGRVTSLSVTGRQGSGIAAPQLNKEEARGLWSGSPTESSHLEERQMQGHERQKSVDTLGTGGGMKRSNSSRSILDTFGFGGGKARDRDGDRSVEALRKASFSSTVGTTRKGSGKEGISTSAQGQMSGHSHRLSAHSVAQAAARLPTTPAIATTAYGDATNENSQVGLVSRFLAVFPWNPKPPSAQQRDRNGKGRAYTTPNSGTESPRRSVFPESPFAAAHASLVRTMMEEGARPASTVQGYGSGPRPHRADSGPLPRSNTPNLSALTLTPAYDSDSRGKASARDANKASKDNTLVLGLTPFEMSIRRCLDQRKGAVKLSTGGPLGPLPP